VVLQKVIESQQLGGKILDTLNLAPAIVKWQQMEQFKLQANNSLIVEQYHSNAHLVDISVANTGEVALKRSQCIVDSYSPWQQARKC